MSSRGNPLVCLLYAGLLSLTFGLARAQQFQYYQFPIAAPGMSAPCKTMLNTTIACSTLLATAAKQATIPRLKLEGLNDICTTTCLTSLSNLKQSISTTCEVTDLMSVRGQLYPASYLVDYFTYAYKTMCRRDSSSQRFCDVISIELLNQNVFTGNESCSDCNLGAYKLQLDSPFGYSEPLASQFVALTSSCSKAGYAFTTPPPYGTTTSAAASTPTMHSSCVTLYTIGAGNTCNSIAELKNVSSYAIYGPNGIDDCSNLPVDTKICLLGQCKRYQVKTGDTCDGILANISPKIDPELFVAWNPNIDPACSNLNDLVGQQICLSHSSGLQIPELTNDFVTATVTDWPTYTPPPEIQLPVAPGTKTGCLEYRNYKDLVTQEDRFYSSNVQYTDTVIANHCSYIISFFEITLYDLLAWNPSLNAVSCTLAPGYSYCVDHPDRDNDPIDTGRCEVVTPSIIPAGTTASCNCYTKYSAQEAGWITCSNFVNSYSISATNLLVWNPWLGANCDTGLFANMPANILRGICIGVGGPVVSSSSSGTTSTGTTQTSSSSVLSTTSSQTTAVSSSSTGTVSSSTTSFSSISTVASSTTISSSLRTSSTTTTTTTSSSVPTPPAQACISGSGEGNFAGLCSYSCHYNYCPPGPCVCLVYGQQVPAPPTTHPNGYPVPGLDASYLGLCSFTCQRGYCAAGACTYTAP